MPDPKQEERELLLSQIATEAMKLSIARREYINVLEDAISRLIDFVKRHPVGLRNASGATNEAMRVADCWKIGEALLKEVDDMLGNARKEESEETAEKKSRGLSTEDILSIENAPDH